MWLSKQQESFENLKELSSMELVLAYSKDYGSEPGIALDSCTLFKAEKQYGTHRILCSQMG